MRSALDTKLRYLRPTAVVIRSMDWPTPPVRPRETVVRARLVTEGMLMELCRNHTSAVAMMDGKAIADLLGIRKPELEGHARARLGQDLGEAGAAALAAIYRDSH